MARDEVRHGRALEGLLKRYLGGESNMTFLASGLNVFVKFFINVVICAGAGVPSFIIFAIKKRWNLGIWALIICGLAGGFIHWIAAVILGVLFVVGAIFAYNERM